MARTVNFMGYLQRVVPMLIIWGTMVHEYGHLIALRLMGLHGEIRSTGLNLTYLTNGATPEQLTVWYFSGGFLQAIYGLYNMINESDNETWLSGYTIIWYSLIYAIFETQKQFAIGSITGITITTLILLIHTTRGDIRFE